MKRILRAMKRIMDGQTFTYNRKSVHALFPDTFVGVQTLPCLYTFFREKVSKHCHVWTPTSQNTCSKHRERNPKTTRGSYKARKRVACIASSCDLGIAGPKSWREKSENSPFLSARLTTALIVETLK